MRLLRLRPVFSDLRCGRSTSRCEHSTPDDKYLPTQPRKQSVDDLVFAIETEVVQTWMAGVHSEYICLIKGNKPTTPDAEEAVL